MNKQILGLLTAVSLTAAPATGAFAADKANAEPDVYVNESLIMFEDQNAKIIDDVTLVPARGVFECLGYDVEWDNDDRTVTVTSDTGVRSIVLTIDSDIMEIYTFKTIMQVDHTQYTLEVPAQIINDRTMIPLRAISESFDCTVEWDEENYRVDITAGEPILLEGAQPAPEPAESEMLKMSLSTDAETVSAGEEFDVYVNVANSPTNNFLSGIVTSFGYDKSKFEFVSGTLLNNDDEPLESTVMAENPDYPTGAKALYVTIYGETARTTDGRVMKATFRSLTGESGEIALTNNYDTLRGFESYLMFNDSEYDIIYEGKDLIVDKTPVVINAAE